MSVTDAIKTTKAFNTFFKDMATALGIGIRFGVAGKRGDKFQAILSEKLGKVTFAFACNGMAIDCHCKIMPDDYTPADPPDLFYKILKCRMKFRGAAGEVDRLNLRILFDNATA